MPTLRPSSEREARVVATELTLRVAGHTPVRQVSVRLYPGEVFGLIGPNGGGKSTLLLLLAGLVRPTEGSVVIDDAAAETLAHTATGTVGLITAEPGLYPLLSGRENLTFFGGLYGLSPDEVSARTAPLLQELDVHGDLDRPSRTYSSGMRQKISLARALLLQPRVLLLDEPTANLDPLSSATIHRAVRARADAGVCVVIATHDLHAAAHICDRVGAMHQRLDPVQRLDGPRQAPPVGELHALFEAAVSPPSAPPLPSPLTSPSVGNGGGAVARGLLLARREAQEQSRQPVMLAAIAVLYALITGLALASATVALGLEARPQTAAWLLGTDSPTAVLSQIRASVSEVWIFLLFTQYLGIAGVLCGHSVLHDRQCGTLTFLLLAPVQRLELWLAKLLGAIAWPTALYLLAAGVGGLGMGVATRADWWIAVGITTPVWAVFVGGLCTVISGLAHDVRTAQQGVWFVLFFASLAMGGTLTWTLGQGVGTQLGVALLAAAGVACVAAAGSGAIGRDLGR